MDERLRATLLEHSDSRACRRVWAGEREGEADPADYVEAMRVTGGRVAAVVDDGAGEVYVRWAGGYEQVTVWPPWTIGAVEPAEREGVTRTLTEGANPRAIPHAETPFASEGVRPDGTWR